MGRRKNREDTEIIQETCRYCHSYSGGKIGYGWCMKLRMQTRTSSTCANWN